MDEVGYMVQSICSDGTLRIRPLGGLNPAEVVGQRALILNTRNEKISGVFASIPVHYRKQETWEFDDLKLDVGTTCKEETQALGIVPGCFGVPDITCTVCRVPDLQSGRNPHNLSGSNKTYLTQTSSDAVDSSDAERSSDSECSPNPEQILLQGKAFDDRIGCAALIDTLQELEKLSSPAGTASQQKPQKEETSPDSSEHSCDGLRQNSSPIDWTMGLFSVQEEVGERGAECAMHVLEKRAFENRLEALADQKPVRFVMPQAAICFEGCPADDTFEERDLIQTALGKGPMVRAMDRSMITHPRLMALARAAAEAQNIPLQVAVRKGGGTNGGIFHTHDIPTLVIGIPVRYAHASCGYCSLQDYENAVKLAVEIVSRLSAFLNHASQIENWR